MKRLPKLVAKPEGTRLPHVTDGVQKSFLSQTSCGEFEGVEHENTGGGIQFHSELALLDDTYLVE